MSAPTSTLEVRERLQAVTLLDEARLTRRLDGTRKIKDPVKREAALRQIVDDVGRAEQRLAARAAAVPVVSYPESLPVSARRDDIADALRENQVVVLAGETGSGKTTQLPKVCLELGRGVRGLIGHTQPRRLAARTVAERIAEELGTPLGATVGYKVRFQDTSSDRTLVKLMTDGILLAEIQQDRLLRQYDTIIVDEAHERSLNIDFLLGHLTRLLPQRPDLKVVVTSATIETQRFSDHFGGAPVIEVSGRTYPVEVRYRPLVAEADRDDETDDAEPRDLVTAIGDAVDELAAEPPGDVLVFLSGEREIRDAEESLRGRLDERTEVVPLYARLSSAEQHRVFEARPRGISRRVVLATNVAETSLTVPGIRYVVDPGTARISRYSLRTKVQRLPIEPVSRASADQRKGRCGRVAEGVCIRLYSQEDFEGRPEFTDPEIARTNLASVVLQMAAQGLGDIADFPFVDPPDRRQVKDGVDLLHELGALDERGGLTQVGRRLARLPVDPRLGRMVLEADRLGCVREVVVIASALSLQDVRERPADKQAQADQLHARFRDPTSDFLAYVNLWDHLSEQRAELSGNRFRRMCKSEFLHYLRVREWQDLHGQLSRTVADLGIASDDAPSDPVRIHTALLAGLLSHVGLKDDAASGRARAAGDYLGARGARFTLFPGSALAKRPPRWVVAAELVETSRLFGRTAARIDPAMVEPLAQHLVKRTYSEPRWSKKQAAVLADERVTLYGVPLVSGRTVNYGRIDPETARDLFLRHALVQGEWDTHHAFFAANRALLGDVEELEARARRRDLAVDDETLFAYYDARVPADVVSGRHFDSWWKTARRSTPDLLTLRVEDLVREGVSKKDYPDAFVLGDVRMELTYQFEPGTDADGVTVHVPLAVLNRIDPTGPGWQVPGLRQELVEALLRSLPKPLRTQVVPVPDTARWFLSVAPPYVEPLTQALERELRRRTGVLIGPDDWDWAKVPAHLRLTWRVEDADGRPLAEDQDLAALRVRLAGRVRGALSAAASSLERSGMRAWELGPELPRTFTGGPVVGFPALADEGGSVAVRVLPSAAEQARTMRAGTRRLLALTVPSQSKAVLDRLAVPAKLALARNPHGSVPALLDDSTLAAVDALLERHGGPVWTEAEFARLRDLVRADLHDVLLEVVTLTERVLSQAAEVETALAGLRGSAALEPALADARAQLAALVHPGFVVATGLPRLPSLRRYLTALVRRLERLPQDPARDRARLAEVQQLEADRAALLARLPVGRRHDPDVEALRWMIEELRVQHFGGGLKTAHPVSEQRVLRAMDAVEQAPPAG